MGIGACRKHDKRRQLRRDNKETSCIRGDILLSALLPEECVLIPHIHYLLGLHRERQAWNVDLMLLL